MWSAGLLIDGPWGLGLSVGSSSLEVKGFGDWWFLWFCSARPTVPPCPVTGGQATQFQLSSPLLNPNPLSLKSLNLYLRGVAIDHGA